MIRANAWDWPLVEGSIETWREWAKIQEELEREMATEPCSPMNKPGGPKPPGKPMPGSSKPTSPGACSNPSAK